MSEVLERRLSRAQAGDRSFLPEPDLIVIDGGRGQVNVVKKVLSQMNIDIPVIGLAKKNEEIFDPAGNRTIKLSRHDEGLRLLQRLRDEAHRYAIQYNRHRRSGRLTKSELDKIEGIGEMRKKALLNHLGSIDKIKNASLAELEGIPGINKKAAHNVYYYFHEKKE